jgi:hypothetical protein
VPTIQVQQGASATPIPATSEEKSKKYVKRLAPEGLDDISEAVVRELTRRGCRIPQVFFYQDLEPENVIKGHFTAPDQIDVAVLCSRKEVSSLLVFRNSSASDVAELAPTPDNNYFQEIGQEQQGYFRYLSVADAKSIKQHAGPNPPPIDHEGISDAFFGKASTVWYWHDGKWLQLSSAK